MTPQIELDSPLGKKLTELARNAETVVEVGTGGGMGSTQCLIAGLNSSLNPYDPLLITIEGCHAHHKEACDNLQESPIGIGIEILYGVLHRTIRPYFHPLNRAQDLEAWDFENTIRNYAPELDINKIVLRDDDIDLLFLDGGEFTSDGDFLALWDRARVIVLDDCNGQVAAKTVYPFMWLDRAGWNLETSQLQDRNGWSVWRRP